jgi:hypothetical protein
MKLLFFSIQKLLAIFLITSLSCGLNDIFKTATLGNDSSSLTEEEVISGLKEALGVGIDTAAIHLNTVGGYLLNEAIKIALPEDVSTALSYVESFQVQVSPLTNILKYSGIDAFNFSVFNGLRDSLMVSMNRAAEKAAPLSVDIFKRAITGMTIKDGFDILNGHDTAAASFLKTKTFSSLTDAFEPFVDSTLALVDAQVLWQKLSLNYNSVASLYRTIQELPQQLHGDLPVPPFDSLATDLSLFTTEKALNGLFYAIGEQESLIRKDPAARVTEILRKVFGTLK